MNILRSKSSKTCFSIWYQQLKYQFIYHYTLISESSSCKVIIFYSHHLSKSSFFCIFYYHLFALFVWLYLYYHQNLFLLLYYHPRIIIRTFCSYMALFVSLSEFIFVILFHCGWHFPSTMRTFLFYWVFFPANSE